eukprot:1003205-Pleurochrysis_carterae.AAC.1
MAAKIRVPLDSAEVPLPMMRARTFVCFAIYAAGQTRKRAVGWLQARVRTICLESGSHMLSSFT